MIMHLRHLRGKLSSELSLVTICGNEDTLLVLVLYVCMLSVFVCEQVMLLHLWCHIRWHRNNTEIEEGSGEWDKRIGSRLEAVIAVGLSIPELCTSMFCQAEWTDI